MYTHKPKIAIIGAGPSGCMLARLLHLENFNVTVFEGDATPHDRKQGNSLDLHDATGIHAFREAGLYEKFKQRARYDGQYTAIMDKDLRYFFVRDENSKDGFGQRPEIDRTDLREILAESLPEGTIQWGRRLVRVESNTLVFKDGMETGFDLIIGADGAWSKVRTAIDSTIKPQYLGLAHCDLRIPDPQKITPALYDLVNRGSIFAGNEGQRVCLQQMGDGSIYLSACFIRESPTWMTDDDCGYDSSDTESLKMALLKEFSEWSPEFRFAISVAQGPPASRSLHTLPVGARWEHKPGMTLIGDAAHLMTPYAGEGVNQALMDAVELARAISEATERGTDLNEAVESFEDMMFQRVTKVQQLSYDLCQDWMFTPGDSNTILTKVVTRHVQHAAPDYLSPLVAAGIHSYFWFRNLFTCGA